MITSFGPFLSNFFNFVKVFLVQLSQIDMMAVYLRGCLLGSATTDVFGASYAFKALSGVGRALILHCRSAVSFVKQDFLSAKRILLSEWMAYPVIGHDESRAGGKFIARENDSVHIADFLLGIFRPEEDVLCGWNRSAVTDRSLDEDALVSLN